MAVPDPVASRKAKSIVLERVRHSFSCEHRPSYEEIDPFIVPFFIIIAVAFASYIHWAKSTFVSREIKRRTGAQEVRVLDEMHTTDKWYGKAQIDRHTGKQLFAQYDWKHGFEKKVALAGRILSVRPPDCSTCFYRIEVDPHDSQYHPYNYTVYVLSPDLKVLEVYEEFEG